MLSVYFLSIFLLFLLAGLVACVVSVMRWKDQNDDRIIALFVIGIVLVLATLGTTVNLYDRLLAIDNAPRLPAADR